MEEQQQQEAAAPGLLSPPHLTTPRKPSTPLSANSPASLSSSNSGTSSPASIASPSCSQSPTSASHYLSNLSYDALLSRLSRLQQTERRVRAEIGRKLALNPQLAAQHRIAIHSVDCQQLRHSIRLHSYDSFQSLQERLAALVPPEVSNRSDSLRGLCPTTAVLTVRAVSALRLKLVHWVHLGLQKEEPTEVREADDERADSAVIHPLPVRLQRATLRQLLQHCDALTAVDASPSSASPSALSLPLTLIWYGEVECWLRLSYLSPAPLVRLPSVRATPQSSLRRCCSSLQSTASSLHSLRPRLRWHWYRAVKTVTRGLDMTRAAVLEPSLSVLSCGLHERDCVLVADVEVELEEAEGGEAAETVVASVSPLPSLSVVVQRLCGAHLSLSLPSSASILSLKQHLQSSYGIPLQEQQLFLQQQQALDDALLSSYCSTAASSTSSAAAGQPSVTLLLRSPPPLLTTSAFQRPVTFYTAESIADTRALLQTAVPQRRAEVRAWSLTECALWLEDCSARIGRLWQHVASRSIKGVGATGLHWTQDDRDDYRPSGRTAGSAAASRRREEICVEAEGERADADLSTVAAADLPSPVAGRRWRRCLTAPAVIVVSPDRQHKVRTRGGGAVRRGSAVVDLVVEAEAEAAAADDSEVEEQLRPVRGAAAAVSRSASSSVYPASKRRRRGRRLYYTGVLE